MHSTFASLMGANPADDHLHVFETSWLLPAFALFCFRALISLYVFTSIFANLAWNSIHYGSFSNSLYFSYFTNLSFWGLGFYFLFAALHTFLYYRTGRSVLFDKWPRALRALHSLYYSTIVTYPFIVTIFYWALLFRGAWFEDDFEAWKNISTHIFPSFFALFEIIFTATPPPPFLHLPFLIVMLVLYLGVAYITHAREGIYVYPFLNPYAAGKSHGIVTGYCFGILAACIVVFLMSWGLISLRRWLAAPGRKQDGSQGFWSPRSDIEMGIPRRK